MENEMEQSEIAATVYKVLSALYHPQDVLELRILGLPRGEVKAGYYDDKIKMADRAAHYSGRGNSIYAVVNPVNPEIKKRPRNKLTEWAKDLTKDKDIPHRRYVFVDCDPVRPSNLSATDTEHQAAIEKAWEIREWLMQEMNFPDMFLADSGNGAHLLIPVDLPNDGATTQVIKSFLALLAERFDSKVIKIDQCVFNAARLIKIWGTKASKGENLLERPHRFSQLLHMPELAK